MLFAWLHRYPFLRLLCPLVVGIYCGDELFFQRQSGRIAFGVILLLFLSFGGLFSSLTGSITPDVGSLGAASFSFVLLWVPD